MHNALQMMSVSQLSTEPNEHEDKTNSNEHEKSEVNFYWLPGSAVLQCEKIQNLQLQYLRLCRISPLGLMRRKALLVVAWWNRADFALAKNVSGHQILSSISLLMQSSSLLSLKRSRSSYQCWRK